MGRRARMVRFAGAIASITAIVGAGLVATPVPSGATDGSHTESMESAPGQWSVLRDGFDDANTSVPAPADGGVRAAQATFQVNYSGFPTDARIAFQAAVDIWASYVASPVPIVIDASWTPLPTGILGRADATVVLPVWRPTGDVEAILADGALREAIGGAVLALLGRAPGQPGSGP